MHFRWKRWRLAPVAALTALAMSLALAGPAAAAEPGEAGSWNGEQAGNQNVSAAGQISQARNGPNGSYLLDAWRGAGGDNQVWLSLNNGLPFTLGSTTTYYNPTVVSWGSDSFFIFHVGTDNNIYYSALTYNDGWSWSGRWVAVPLQSTSGAVSVAQYGPGSHDLFMVYRSSNSDQIWGTYFDGDQGTGWGQTATIAGGLSPSAPAVAYNPAVQVMYVVARGEDNQVWMTDDWGGQWNSWFSQGGGTYLPPSIAALPDGNMLVGYVDQYSYVPTYRTYDQYGFPTGDWSPDITGIQSFASVAFSVVAYAATVVVLFTAYNSQVYWKSGYQG
jgi:hypothetical protein